jgi:hypothetical protein
MMYMVLSTGMELRMYPMSWSIRQDKGPFRYNARQLRCRDRLRMYQPSLPRPNHHSMLRQLCRYTAQPRLDTRDIGGVVHHIYSSIS